MSNLHQSSVALFSFSFILLLTHLAASAPVNVTDGKAVGLMLEASGLGAPTASCATGPAQWPEWFQASETFDRGDCKGALNLFYNDYVKDHAGVRYEFLSSGVTPVHGIPTQRVPLKIAIGTCTIAIAMRNEFKTGELPAETPFRSAGSDISSFAQVYKAALDIDEKCSEPLGEPGWYPTGDLNSIGVFIWQAASEINKRIVATAGANLTTAPHGTLSIASESNSMVGDTS